MERSEEEEEEREGEGFCEKLKGCIEVCEDRGKIVVIGDMSAKVGNREVKGV